MILNPADDSMGVVGWENADRHYVKTQIFTAIRKRLEPWTLFKDFILLDHLPAAICTFSLTLAGFFLMSPYEFHVGWGFNNIPHVCFLEAPPWASGSVAWVSEQSCYRGHDVAWGRSPVTSVEWELSGTMSSRPDGMLENWSPYSA